jgi:Ca2+-binding EF-hand superfamily protein
MTSFTNAGTLEDREIEQKFAKCNVTNDGKLTLSQAKNCMPKVAKNFSIIDSQNRGYVTVAQIKALVDSR